MKEYNSIQLEDKEAQFLEELTIITNEIARPISFSGDINTDLKNFHLKSKETFWHENNHIIGLYLARFDLKFLPENIGNLSNLRFFVIDGCHLIQSLTSTFKMLKNLEQFLLLNYYEHNLIIHIDFPDIFKDLKNLKKIVIEGRINIYIPPSFVELECLEELHLEACLFSTSRDRFLLNYNIKGVEGELVQTVNDLPDNLGNLKSLRRLKLRSLGIETLPPSIINLKNLLEVDLSHSDKIKNIDIIFDINSLKKINLSRCRINHLPKTIGNLTHLESLNLYTNNIKEVPFELTNCQNLKRLNLRFNDFRETIQHWIGFLIYLTKLEYLRIAEVYLKHIPKELLEKKDLEIKAEKL